MNKRAHRALLIGLGLLKWGAWIAGIIRLAFWWPPAAVMLLLLCIGFTIERRLRT